MVAIKLQAVHVSVYVFHWLWLHVVLHRSIEHITKASSIYEHIRTVTANKQIKVYTNRCLLRLNNKIFLMWKHVVPF